MRRQGNVAIFVPHAGCVHACSFCDQKSISGTSRMPDADEVRRILADAAKNAGDRQLQIAFFGGSFTAIPKEIRASLLEAARPFLQTGAFDGIRISTRPDCISGEILAELKDSGVVAVELGVQSMDDDVLAANRRGHSARDVTVASRMIRRAGFSLGHQMMTGLYRSTPEKDRETARRLAELKPDTVRIYPALVLRNTGLESLYRAGLYCPQTLESATEECAALLRFFLENHIRVIRMGLHAEASLKEQLVAGPYHPAFRECCESRIMHERVWAQIGEFALKPGPIRLCVAPSSVSRMAGQKRSNILALEQKGYRAKVHPDPALARLAVRVEAVLRTEI